jgi:hypothetical protein
MTENLVCLILLGQVTLKLAIDNLQLSGFELPACVVLEIFRQTLFELGLILIEEDLVAGHGHVVQTEERNLPLLGDVLTVPDLIQTQVEGNDILTLLDVDNHIRLL